MGRGTGGSLIRTDAKTAAFALIEHNRDTHLKPKNTICLWFDQDAQEAGPSVFARNRESAKA